MNATRPRSDKGGLNIWCVQTGEPLPLNDQVRPMRSALLARELGRRGHSVTWWASSFDHVKKQTLGPGDLVFQPERNLTIRALRALGYSKNVSLRRVADHVLLARRFRQLAPAQPCPDIIVTSFPDHHMALETASFALSRGIPLLMDVRDQWPDAFWNVLKIPPAVGRIAFWRDERIKVRALRAACSLTSMMQSLLKWGLDTARRTAGPLDRVFYLGAERLAGPSPEDVASVGSIAGIDALRFRDHVVVTFVGTFGSYYQPSLIVDAARRLGPSAPDGRPYLFILAGDGVARDTVTALVRESSLRNVVLPGWVNSRAISAILSVSDLGIVPCNRVIDAFPNKVFTYLSCGVPLLFSVQGELRELAKRHDFGLYVPPGDPDAMAKAIASVVGDREGLTRMRRNASRAFDELFDANRIYADFADHIEFTARPAGAA
jgi:glycosyltransferase involved in cell wall biosynthesis